MLAIRTAAATAFSTEPSRAARYATSFLDADVQRELLARSIDERELSCLALRRTIAGVETRTGSCLVAGRIPAAIARAAPLLRVTAPTKSSLLTILEPRGPRLSLRGDQGF